MINNRKYNIPFDLDSPERTMFHKEIISEKKFLRNLYEGWYKLFIDKKNTIQMGKCIELGSGGGFLKEIDSDIICSDIIDLPGNDLTFSALDMPFKEDELSGIFMIDTFHHIPDSRKFLNEVSRVLKKDGILLMIEPANSLWGRFIYKNFHHEPFEVKGNWTIPESGPLSGANGALPWIVFERDYDLFHSEFPNLRLKKMSYHTPFRYLLSGGVSYKQFVPDASYRFFCLVDNLMSSISKHFSMFTTIEIRKI